MKNKNKDAELQYRAVLKASQPNTVVHEEPMINPKGLEQALMDADYNNKSIDYIVRAVNSYESLRNSHEVLLQNLKNARAAISALSADTQTRLMDEIDEALAQAEQGSNPHSGKGS